MHRLLPIINYSQNTAATKVIVQLALYCAYLVREIDRQSDSFKRTNGYTDRQRMIEREIERETDRQRESKRYIDYGREDALD